MTYNFYLNRNEKQRNKVSIFLYARENGKTICLNTEEYIETNGLSIKQAIDKYWDNKLQKVKSNYIGSLELNQYLAAFKLHIQNFVRKLREPNPYLSFEEIKEQLIEKTKPQQIIDFHTAFSQFIEIRKNEVTISTTKKFKTLQNILKEFEKSTQYKITFKNIDLMFKDLLLNFLINEKKLATNTISKYFDLLRTFLIWSLDRKIHSNTEFHKFKLKTVPTDIVYLTPNELEKLYSYDFSNNLAYERVRDVFCFACYTGQRFSDVSNFKFIDIENNIWNLRTQKTKEINKIPLIDNAVNIIQKYEQQGLSKLPTICNQKTNFYLKEICKIAGINDKINIVSYKGTERLETEKYKYELITTHTARRTFVTLSLEKGMRQEIVMKVTGHNDLKSFKKYLKIADSVKFSEMLNIWNDKPTNILKIA